MKNLILHLFYFINLLIFYFNKVEFGRFYVKGIVNVKNGGSIKISSGVRINSGYRYNPIGGDERVNIITQYGGKVTIGSDTAISNCTFFSRSSITVGKSVMIGGGVKIYDSDFHSLNSSHRSDKNLDRNHTVSKDIVIKDHAFIGSHTIILKGVTIGKRAVVGAGSVVTKSIPDNEIWAGNPAVLIKRV